MKWFSLAFLCLIFLTFDVSAQDFNEIYRRIKTTTENKEYPAAIVELETLKKDSPKIFELNNYDYLLARLAEKTGDSAAAAANYEAVAARGSRLSEYALWHLSQIYRASGNFLMERIYLQKIAATAPESLLLKAINQRLPRSFFDSQDYDATIRLLSVQPSMVGSQPSATVGVQTANQNRENSILLGRAYLENGKTNEAKEIFTRLINDGSNAGQPDDFALTALQTLDEMTFGKEMSTAKLPPLSDYELLRRAQIYQFNRDFARARFYFQAIVEKYPASGITPDALYQIGRTYAQEKNYAEAINWFERVQAEFPAHPVAKDALSQTASAYARINKPQEAVARYQKFITQYADADTLDRAYLNIVDVYRDTNANADALKWTQKTQEIFRGKTPEAVALFAQVRIRFAQNDWANALKDLEGLSKLSDLGGTRVPGGTNTAEITFLKGFALENLNRYAEAIDVYLSIPDGRSEYYGWRATERLKSLANDEKTTPTSLRKFESLREITKQNISINNATIIKQAAQSSLRLLTETEIANEVSVSGNITTQEILLNVLRQTYAVLPAYQKIPNGKILALGRTELLREKPANSSANYHKNLADELLFLALYDEAAPELESSQQKPDAIQTNDPKSVIRNPKSDYDYTLAVINKRGDHANRAVAYAESLWRNVPADYQIELIPRDQIELLYPAPYSDSLLKYAPERRVDPRFLLSIMRQESRFRPDVKSDAAARGLMQFIRTTADQIAGELGRENFGQDELYNPPTAILFGSQYVGDLFKLFPNQPAAVAGSYNGGEDNVARWAARSKSGDADRYVPEIIFTQSKDYVYKVLAADRVYRTVYDENLRVR
ncbi:MAG: transglycosylase SLT domain-containing protein [Acidobacteriota bacterium]|nr:transglycosylase SLT domain-containing protein [Acidobacteriota bacterium]